MPNPEAVMTTEVPTNNYKPDVFISWSSSSETDTTYDALDRVATLDYPRCVRYLAMALGFDTWEHQRQTRYDVAGRIAGATTWKSRPDCGALSRRPGSRRVRTAPNLTPLESIQTGEIRAQPHTSGIYRPRRTRRSAGGRRRGR